MRIARSVVAGMVAAAAFVSAAQAQDIGVSLTRAFPDLTLVYRGVGLTDTGGAANSGRATVFFCSNFGSAAATVRINIRNKLGVNAKAHQFSLASNATRTAATHATALFVETATISPGTVYDGGLIAISATSPDVVCSAFVVNAASTALEAIPIQLWRIN